jgi:hypothetical protein
VAWSAVNFAGYNNNEPREDDMKKAASPLRRPIVVKRLDHPDEERRFEKGLFRLVTIGGMELGRAEYQPGWHWSKHAPKRRRGRIE